MKRMGFALVYVMLILGSMKVLRRFMPNLVPVTHMMVGERIAGHENITEARCKEKLGHLVSGPRPMNCGPSGDMYFGYVEGLFRTRICCGPKEGYTK